MNASPQRWLGPMILVGAIYAVIGVVSASPATHVRVWRLAAWGLCGIAYLAHIAFERIRLNATLVRSATHVACGVAVGAFGVAAAANIHAIASGTTEHQSMMRLSLVLWPLVTAVPALFVALGVGAVMRRSA